MSLKPHTWRRSSPRLATPVVAVLSCATFITSLGVVLSAAWLALLFFTHDYESSPPFMIAVATATALAWIWRMQLARAAAEKAKADAEHRADEEIIAAMQRTASPGEVLRRREEDAFKLIIRSMDERA